MPATKEQIIEALAKLKQTDDTHWTDDGAPRVDAVCKLADDVSITRAQINDAYPGFARVATAKPATPTVEREPDATDEVIRARVRDLTMPSDVRALAEEFVDKDPEIDGPGEQMTEGEMKAILAKRITVAESNLEKARTGVNDAQQYQRDCERRVSKARVDFAHYFPPISAAANIKQHLASQQARLLAEVESQGDHGRGQLDQAMQRRNSRGWSRPSRPVNNTAK